MQNNQILLPKNPHVLIVEDHELIKKGFIMVLGFLSPKAVIDMPVSVEEVKNLLNTKKQYDVILLDNNLVKFSDGATCKGIDLIPLIRERCPQAKIVFTSMDHGVGEMLFKQHRVDAFASKENLLDVIRA